MDRRDPHTVHLVGELDLATRDLLVAVLGEAAHPGHDLVVDCTRLNFIDASGIGALVRAAGVIGDGRLRLTNLHGGPAELFDLLDLAGAVPNLRRESG